jgi:23S rRNA pseudouridine1911/1915/1917 synthase
MRILFEDNHLIAVNKPYGMPTQGDSSQDRDLLNWVKDDIKVRHNKPGNVFVGLLHRLDRPVGGVVLFAKTSKAASRLSDQIRRHTVEKVYWAVVEGVPQQPKGSVVQWLVKDEAKNIVTAFDNEVPGSLKAELTYTVLQTKNQLSLVEVYPKTGRPHQIRVAMKSLGTPIAGDVKYGASLKLLADDGGPAIALFARSFGFEHPITKTRQTVVAEPSLPIFSEVKG